MGKPWRGQSPVDRAAKSKVVDIGWRGELLIHYLLLQYWGVKKGKFQERRQVRCDCDGGGGNPAWALLV